MNRLPIGKKFLPRVDRSRLESMMEREPNPRNKIRVRACIARKDGKTIDKIASELNKSNPTIRAWLRRASDSKEKNRYGMKKPGRIPRLNADQIKSLKKDIATGPRSFGFDSGNWSRDILAQHIKQKYRVTYSAPTMQHIKRREGLSWRYTPGGDFLPDIDIKKLALRQKRESDPLVKTRLEACIARKSGKTVQQVAAELGKPQPTIQSWLKRVTKMGIDGIYNKKISRTYLNEKQIKSIKSDIMAGPKACGLNSDVWTANILARHVAKKYGVKYSGAGIGNILHRNKISWRTN